MALKPTHTTKPQSSSAIKREWTVIDASNKIIGRLATQASTLLQGKKKVNYVSYLDMGDNVVVINAASVKFTGRKALQKNYLNYSGYPGGLRVQTLESLMEKHPDQVVRRAISGMLPKNKHRKRRLARLFVYNDSFNPHAAKVSNIKN